MSVVTWWLRARETKQRGGELVPPATAQELAWWAGESRRLRWRYGLQQGVPNALVLFVAGLLMAAQNHHALSRAPALAAMALGGGLVAGYFTGRVMAGTQQAMSIRQQRLREALKN